MGLTRRQKNLLILLIPLLGVFFLGLGVGSVELLVWLALAAAWLYAFAVWGRREHNPPSTR